MDAYYAGAPAGGSDGSWMQAQSADATGIAPSGITPTDSLCANGVPRATSRATTPFGTPQSVGSNISLQARLQSIRMDPQLYQVLHATSPFASPRPNAGQAAVPDQYAIQRSSVGQQEWMYRQMREAAQSMRRGGIDLPNASWTPPW
eukprot:8150009-Pyramimonas_sp.AAC.1